MSQIITIKSRIKDGGNRSKQLRRMANSVNTVWNFCNEASCEMLKKYSKWLSYYDLSKLTSGSGKDLEINSQIVQQVCKEFATRRSQFKKKKLSWRVSRGSRRSLGWIPCTNQNVKLSEGYFKLSGKTYRFWEKRELPGEVKSISLNEDALGHWFINVREGTGRCN